jgi:hypothetical protein
MQPKTKNFNYEEYKEISEVKCLGSLVTYDNVCGKEIRARTEAGN